MSLRGPGTQSPIIMAHTTQQQQKHYIASSARFPTEREPVIPTPCGIYPGVMEASNQKRNVIFSEE